MMDDEYYDPDPNAPLWNKLNPCHCDHIDALTPVQRFCEAFGTYCRCCSGTRVFLLLAAFFCLVSGNHIATFISYVIVTVVCLAIVVTNIAERRVAPEEESDDNGNEG